MNRVFQNSLLAAFLILIAATGCRSKEDTTRSDIQSSLNNYFKAHPVCLFPQPVQFPTNFDSSSPKTDGYDALVDEGYLSRIQSTKKVFIFGSKQVSNYDLNDKGRGIWTADPVQAGFGNFCYGHPGISTLDSVSSSALNNGSNGPVPVGATASAAFHTTVSDAASWANNDKIKTAFPDVASELSGPHADTAALTKTGDTAWQVTSTGSGSHKSAPSLGPKSNDYGVVGDTRQ